MLEFKLAIAAMVDILIRDAVAQGKSTDSILRRIGAESLEAGGANSHSARRLRPQLSRHGARPFGGGAHWSDRAVTKARTIVEKIEDDLAYRLPTSGKPIPVITLSREQAEQLLQEIAELRKAKDR